MKPDVLHHYLENEARGIVTAPVNLWPRLQEQLQGSHSENPPAKRITLRRSAILIAGLVVISLAVFFFGTIPGKVLAQNIIRFFIPLGQTSYQIPNIDQTELVFAGATLKVQITKEANRMKTLESERTLTPISISTPVPSKPNQNCVGPEMLTSIFCQLPPPHTWLDGSVMVLPFLPYPDTMLFESLNLYSTTKIMYITYIDPGITELWLMQGQGDFPVLEYHGFGPASWGTVPEGTVQKVNVGIYPAELVMGDYEYDTNRTTMTWNPDLNVMRLRWKDNEKWYELDDLWYDTSRFDKDDLIALASGIIPYAGYDQISTSAPGTAEIVEKEAGFTIIQPGNLPNGYIFNYAQYDPTAKRVMLLYTLNDTKLNILKYLVFFEMPAVGSITQFPPDYNNPIIIPGTANQVNPNLFRSISSFDTKGLFIEMLYYVQSMGPELNTVPDEIDNLSNIATSLR